MSTKPIKTVQDVLELTKNYSDHADKLAMFTHPCHNESEYEYRHALRYRIGVAETLIYAALDTVASETVVILTGVRGCADIAALPKYTCYPLKRVTLGATEIRGQLKGAYMNGDVNSYAHFYVGDNSLSDKIVFVRFDDSPLVSDKAVVADACAIQYVKNDLCIAMSGDLANNIFKECVRMYYPSPSEASVENRGVAMQRALREIRDAYKVFMTV